MLQPNEPPTVAKAKAGKTILSWIGGPTVRCEMVEAGRHDENEDPITALEDFKNCFKRNCIIGKVRVANWKAIDAVELRTDEMEPALGSELI